MIFKFGDITFNILDAPNSMRVEDSMNFVPIERVKGKPVTQELGKPLITIDMDVVLRYQYSDVTTAISQLTAAMNRSQEHELIDGTGFSYGTFKIRRMSHTVEKTDSKGKVLSAEVQLSFLEYAPYNQEQNDKLKARQAAFANISVSPIEVKKRDLYTTPQALTSVKIVQSTVAAKEGISNLKKAASIPDLATKYLSIAQRQISKASAALKEGRTAVNQVTSTVSNMVTLKATMDNTIASLDTALPQITGADAGDIPGIISGSAANLETQLSSLTSAATIISAVTAIRR